MNDIHRFSLILKTTKLAFKSIALAYGILKFPWH